MRFNRVGEPGYEAHRIRSREYYQANKEKVLAQMKTRGWRKAGLARGAAFHRAMVLSLLRQRDGDMCWLCGLMVGSTEASVEHAQPLCQGGAHTAENIRLTHLKCNLSRPKKLREKVEVV